MTQTHSELHRALLARARTALETPESVDDALRASLISELAAAERVLEVHSLPWPIEIHTGVIEHRHGVNHYVASSRADLMRQLASFCREYWHEVSCGRAHEERDDEAIVSEYFERKGDEFYWLAAERLELERPLTVSLPPIHRFIRLSIRHLSPGTCHGLMDSSESKKTPDTLPFVDTTFGMMMQVPSHSAHHALPEDLDVVLKYASRLGVSIILFHADGDVAEDLPLFD